MILLAPVRVLAQTQPSTDTLDRIDAYLAEQVGSEALPGAALAIIAGDEIVFVKGYGVTSLESKEPVTPASIFPIGSVSKSMTATAILQLQEQGLIDIDAPVQQYLPWFRVADADASARITVRQLLNQSSGLPTNAHGVVWQDEARIRGSLENGVRALETVELHSPPGTRWQYSNMNYATLGLLVETVSGQPYAEYMQEHLFEPLGMEHVSLNPPDTVQEHSWLFGRQVPSLSVSSWGAYVAPAGLYQASAAELARYAAFHLGTSEPSLISLATLEAAHHDGVPTAPGVTYTIGGLIETTVNGERLVWHNGMTQGGAAALLTLPEQNLGAVLLLNSQSGGVVTAMGMNIASMLLGVAPSGPVPAPMVKLLGNVMLVILLISTVLLIWLAFAVRRWLRKGRPANRHWWAILRALVLALLAAAVWVLPYSLVLRPLGMPTTYGVLGYPVDVAIGMCALLAASTLWALYAILAVAIGRPVRG